MNPKTELIVRWLSMAEDDMKVAESTFNDTEPVYWIAAFHAQQSAEKFLKSLLIYHNVEFEKTHDINYLLQLCMDFHPDIEKFREQASKLTDYAVESRYPFPKTEPSKNETREAIETAQMIQQFVFSKLPQQM
jgi:HEPN domain-containing protein